MPPDQKIGVKSLIGPGTTPRRAGSNDMLTPQELRKEAEATEALARLVSYGPDKAWLQDKAAALRREADRQEQIARRSDPPAQKD